MQKNTVEYVIFDLDGEISEFCAIHISYRYE